ncbi:MAG TPA: hypothetical protein VK914_03685 [bacterium]|jgi:hypothetical protein|nr:hypothetical protein [bacterium]
MSNKSMGTGVGMGIHRSNIKKVFGWLWHSWMEAQHEVPILRWVALAAVATAAAAVYLAYSEGGTRLQLIGYMATAVLYALEIPVIFYLLFEVYRKHRTDAIFDSKRLADLIRKLAIEQIEAREEARSAIRKTFLMMPHRDEDVLLEKES